MEPVAFGLREWAAVCSGLGDGRLMIVLRKGGIHERGGGLFVPEQERFALVPTFEHQHEDRVAASLRTTAAATTSPPVPGCLHISHWAEVVRTWCCRDDLAVQSLEAEAPFSPGEIDTRFHYRNKPELFALALRVYRLPTPCDLPDGPAFAGCRSWVDLGRSLATEGSVPVMPTGFFTARLERIAAILDQSERLPP